MVDERSEIKQLKEQVAGLQGDVQRLINELEKAHQARDALIQRVLPLAVPKAEPARTKSRGIIMVLVLLILAAIVAMMYIFPRMANKVGARGNLPYGVEVREGPSDLQDP